MIKACSASSSRRRAACACSAWTSRTSPLEIRARIGYMPENDAHIPGMTAVAFVGYCGELAGLRPVDAISARTRCSTTWASAKRATATSKPTRPA